MSDFTPPLRATRHCRHYSYENSILDGGPRCAAGCDLSKRCAYRACIAEPEGPACPSRAEYTDPERAVWKAWVDARMGRLRAAAALIPKTGWEGRFACPSCGGTVSWRRARLNRHVAMQCDTPHCCGFIQ